MRLLTFPQLQGRGIPYCRDHLRRKWRAGEFPAPVELSPTRIAWVEEEVNAWIEQCIELRDNGVVTNHGNKGGGRKRRAPAPELPDAA
jgi:prophage regulatory protein